MRGLKKILILLFFVFILSGCTTYKFQKSTASWFWRLLAYYDGKPIPRIYGGKRVFAGFNLS